MNKSFLKRYLGAIFLIALSIGTQLAYAVDIPSTAALLGNTPPGDVSVGIFTWLLGSFFTAPLSNVGTPGLIGGLFLTFNSAVFVVGMLWAGYGLLSGVAESASTGEVLGKRMSAVWLPIRMVTGISGIVPVFAGFSLSQVFLVTMTSLGIGIANTMWASAITSINEFAVLSPPAVSSTSAGGIDFKTMSEQLFLMHVCGIAIERSNAAATANLVPPGDGDVLEFPGSSSVNYPNKVAISYTTKNGGDICGRAVMAATYVPGRKGTAYGFRVGSVNYDDYAKRVSVAYIGGFTTFSTDVKALAKTFSDELLKSRTEVNTVATPFPTETLAAAATKYANSVQISLAPINSDVRNLSSGVKADALVSMTKQGWLGAGAWYSTFAEANAAMVDAMKSVHFSYKVPDVSGNALSDQAAADIGSIAKAKNVATGSKLNPDESGGFASLVDYICETALDSTCMGSKKTYTGPLTNATGNWSLGQAIVKGAINASAIGSGGGTSTLGISDTGLVNPIVMFKNMGDTTIGIAWTIMSLLIILKPIALLAPVAAMAAGATKVIAAATAAIPGVNAIAASAAWAAILADIVGKLATFLVFAIPYLFVLGALMAVYIPMIPFITWMGAVTQYAVVVVEGLVGAPIAALSHLESEGEGMGQRTHAGYMFILNVTFRPALMLFGFFFASVLMIAIGTFQVDMFMTAMAGADGNSFTGLVAIPAYLSIFFVLNVTLIQSLFNLIFMLPDQVMAMVGSHGTNVNLGKENESKIHGIFVGGGRGLSSSVGQVGRGAPKDETKKPGAKKEDVKS